MTLPADVCNSFVDLATKFLSLFQSHVGYEVDPTNDRGLGETIDILTQCIPNYSWRASGLQDLTMAFETILATIIDELPAQETDHNPLKWTYVNLFESAASVVIGLAMSRVQQHQKVIKENFMADLLGRVDDDIRKELLIDEVEPVYNFGHPETLDALHYKAINGRDAQLSDALLGPSRNCFRAEVVNEDTMKKIFDVCSRVVGQYDIPSVDRFVRYLQMKNKRNRKVHQCEDVNKDYLRRHPGTPTLQLSDFITNTCLHTPRAFTKTEIDDMKSFFFEIR